MSSVAASVCYTCGGSVCLVWSVCLLHGWRKCMSSMEASVCYTGGGSVCLAWKRLSVTRVEEVYV